MRDLLKGTDYFETRIIKLKKDITAYEALLSETIKEKEQISRTRKTAG